MIYKQKSPFFVLCFSFFFSALLSAQNAPKDIIVLVDTSSSMSSFYANVTDYLTGPFLEENLNLGDTFHLISFSGKPRFEIARRIIDLGDVQTINGRIFLLYPLEPVSDIAAAISYGEKYTTIIPSGRQKRIFIIGDSELKDVEGLVNAAGARLRESGATIRYLKVPLSVPARPQGGQTASTSPQGGSQTSSSSGRSPATASGSSAPPVSPGRTESSAPTGTSSGSSVRAESPGVVSGSPGRTDLPTRTDPPVRTEPPAQTSSSVQTGASAQAESPAVTDPSAAPVQAGTPVESGALPPETLPESPRAESIRSAPVPDPAVPDPVVSENGTNASGRSSGGFNFSLSLPLLIGLGILALLIFGFIIFTMLKNLNSSPKRVMASAATIHGDSAVKNAELLNSFASTAKTRGVPPRRYHREEQNQFLSNPPMLNLCVEDQNTAIGRRNVHTLKPGSRFTLGGGASDFLIFLVPLPPRIGELRFDGTNCTFIPLKSKYFPDIGSQAVPECIGKPIRVLSDKHYEIFFHFERYKDPLIALNQLLHSINVPEK
ncbi:MAG: hypothetical protein LBP29_09280 [Treponema sp.]|jgi:hypothetical protein|nr:hypothetical protein [Treponema sp.]